MKITNAEWLRSLSDEQLLDWLCDDIGACWVDNNSPHCSDSKQCRECWQRWLKTQRTEEI